MPRVTSDTATIRDSSAAHSTLTQALQRSAVLSPSHSLSAASGAPGSGSYPHQWTKPLSTGSARSAHDAGSPDGEVSAGAAVRALSPFVPRLLRSELAAEAPRLPSLAGLASITQPEMVSIAKVRYPSP